MVLEEGCCLVPTLSLSVYHHPHLPPKQALATNFCISIPFSQAFLQQATCPIAFPFFCKKISTQRLWHVLKRFHLPRKCGKLGSHQEIRVRHSGLLDFAFQVTKLKPSGTQFKSSWPSWGPDEVTPYTLDHIETLAKQGQTESHGLLLI